MPAVEVTGSAELAAALERLAAAGKPAARQAALAMAAAAEREIKLLLSTSDHPPGTAPPSAPGEPPSLVTGQLRRSVRMTRSAGTAARWETQVAPTTVYGRIQELGGRTGRGHRTYLPPRPYVRPAMELGTARIRAAAVQAFRRALGEA